jgi:FdhD protein
MTTTVAVRRWLDGREERCQDRLADEVPVALEYNGIGHAVMLATPADLEDFALGFSLTEGIVGQPADVLDCDVEEVQGGIRVALRIAGHCFANLKERRRSLAGRTGCGLCGVDSLSQVRRPLGPVNAMPAVDIAALQNALHTLPTLQPLQRETGAAHAAAWVTGDGEIVCLREDVGRHNALDKLIGALARQGTDFGAGAALITSRASYEMVQKAAAVGIGIVAAVSAPTAYAVRLAEELNVTLIGFLRPRGQVLYAHPARLF